MVKCEIKKWPIFFIYFKKDYKQNINTKILKLSPPFPQIKFVRKLRGLIRSNLFKVNLT